MNLEQSYQKRNRWYKRAVRREVTGITLYYETLTRKEAIGLLKEWNAEGAGIGIHAIIIGDKVIQTLPWDYKGRYGRDHVGSGNIIILIASSQEMDAESVYENTVELCAVLCKEYHLHPREAVTSPDRQLKELPAEIEALLDEVTFNEKKPYQVMVTATRLNIRMGPSVDTKSIGTVKRGTILTIEKEKDNWGWTKEKQGYINLAYTKRI